MHAKEMIKMEIDKLPENLVSEVYSFIKFLENRKENTNLVHASQTLSESSFQKIWENEEDAVYDDL
jgi:hypothetical protein